MKAMLIVLTILTFSFIAGAVGAPTSTTVDHAMADLQKTYDDVAKDIVDLKKKAMETTGQAKRDMQSQIKNLEKDQHSVAVKMEKMKTATGSAWDDLKQGAFSALDGMKKAINKAEEKFK